MTMRTFLNAHAWLIAGAVLLTSCENLDTYEPSDILPAPALAAVAASPTEVALSWARPTGVNGKVSYHVFRNGTSLGYMTSLEHLDRPLTPSTTYTYAVGLVDRFGHSSPLSAAVSVTTLPEGTTDETAPSAPANLTAVASSATSIMLSWSESTDNTGVLGYRIFRDGVQVATSSTPSYTDTGLTASTMYTYTVAAYDGAGNVSAPSSAESATTLAAGETDTEAPSIPASVVATAASATQITIVWEPSTDNNGVIGYAIFYDGAVIDTVAGTVYLHEGRSPSTLHTYTIVAIDAHGNHSEHSEPAAATTPALGTVDLEAPTVPATVVASASSATEITVSWAAATDNTGVLGYRVLRNGTEIATTAATSFDDTGLTASTEYTYTVIAYDAAGNASLPSLPAVAMTLSTGTTDTEAPTTPTGVVAAAVSPSSIALTWNASTDNVGVVGYRVFRGGVQVATTVTTSYTDNGRCAATLYSYTVAAIDAADNASASSAPPATATTPHIAVGLGSAGNFSVLAGTGLSLTGLLPSNITGNVGLGQNSLLGGVLLNLLDGVLHAGNSTAVTAQVDLGNAISSLLALPVCAGNTLVNQLGGLTLKAGVHATTAGAALNGTLTLDADGDPNAVFVIKVPGTLNIAANAQVNLTDGAKAENVFFVVDGSTNIGTLATVRGNILTKASATLGLSASVQGRVLANTGLVSMLVNTVGLLLP